MSAWKDTTSYSQGDTKREPRVWTLQAGHLRIMVHRHIDCPGDWLLSCADAGFDRRWLSASDVEAAKAQALTLVRARLTAALKALEDTP